MKIERKKHYSSLIAAIAATSSGLRGDFDFSSSSIWFASIIAEIARFVPANIEITNSNYLQKKIITNITLIENISSNENKINL